MMEGSKETGSDVYVLETGDCGAARLQMQDEIYGASTRQMMLDAGLKAGMRVLDLACGTGIMSHWIAKQVGRTGTVVGGDISRDQLAYARAQGGTVKRRGLLSLSNSTRMIRVCPLRVLTWCIAGCCFAIWRGPRMRFVRFTAC
jgi:SAM-dependent methyltransferase